MVREEIMQSWIDHVHEDISAAECLLQGGHWLYVAFMCHQAIEKALKAYYVATNEDDPPYTHSHTRLLNVCGLTDELTDTQLRFVARMEPMYIKARYPEQKAKVAKTLNGAVCQEIIKTTKEITQWIEQRLPANKLSTLCENTSE